MTTSSDPITILVTGASGKQGRALISNLSTLNQESNAAHTFSIRALVRDPSSTKAQDLLRFSGPQTSIILTEGNFTESASLAKALAPSEDGTTVSAVFLNTLPTFTNLEEEVHHATGIIDAARAAGVKHIVYPSVVGLADTEVPSRIGTFPPWVSDSAIALLGPADAPGIESIRFRSQLLSKDDTKIDQDAPSRKLLSGYFGAKVQIEYLVKTWGGTWTVLRPTWFMTNFLPPSSKGYWAELVPGNPVLRSALAPEGKMMLVDPDDIGAVAARAILGPFLQERTSSDLVNKTVNVGSQALGLTEMARALSDAAGVEVRPEFVGEKEAAKEVREGNLQRDAQAWVLGLHDCFEAKDLASIIGRAPRKFEEFLAGRKEEVKAFLAQ